MKLLLNEFYKKTKTSLHKLERKSNSLGLYAITFSILMVLNCVFDFLPLQDPIFREVPFLARLLSFTVICIVLFLLVTNATYLHTYYARIKSRGLPFTCIIGGIFIFFIFVLLRPRIHYGDSDWVIMLLRENCPFIDKWLVIPHLLNYIYQPLSEILYPGQFLTLFHSLLGVIGVVLGVVSVNNIILENKTRNVAYIFLFSSYATFALFSGYMEIYSVTQFGIIIFVTAIIGLLTNQSWMNYFLFGLIVSLTGLLYWGTLPLIGLSLIPLSYSLLNKLKLYAYTLKQLAKFCFGAIVGTYLSSWMISEKIILNPGEVLKMLKQVILPLTVVKLEKTNNLYLSSEEIFSIHHFLEVVDVWVIYGIFGFILCGLSFIVAFQQFHRDKIITFHKDGIFVTLLSVSLFYLISMYIKRFEQGFKDWDLFSYAVFAFNFLAIYSYNKWVAKKKEFNNCVSILKYCSLVWFLFILFIMTPISPKWNFIPQKKLLNTVSNYNFFKPIELDTHLRDIARLLKTHDKCN